MQVIFYPVMDLFLASNVYFCHSFFCLLEFSKLHLNLRPCLLYFLVSQEFTPAPEVKQPAKYNNNASCYEHVKKYRKGS